MSRLPEPIADNKEKVFNLCVELQQAKRDKKEAGKAHGDNIKRIEDEIKDILEAEENETVQAQDIPA